MCFDFVDIPSGNICLVAVFELQSNRSRDAEIEAFNFVKVDDF